jgi:hypothetical protein
MRRLIVKDYGDIIATQKSNAVVNFLEVSKIVALGSTGCQPVLLGSLPRSLRPHQLPSLTHDVVGKLPTTAG